MKKTNTEDVMGFRTSLAGVGAILDLPYRTLVPWTKWYRLAGKRGRQRYGIPELLKFNLVSVLSRSGFNVAEVRESLRLLPWIVEKDSAKESWFVLIPVGGESVNVSQFSNGDRFTAALSILLDQGIPFSVVSLTGLSRNVIRRVAAHLEGKPFIPSGDGIRKAMMDIAAANRDAGRPANWVPERDKIDK